MNAQILLFPNPLARRQRPRHHPAAAPAVSDSSACVDADADANCWSLAEQLAHVLGRQMHIALHEAGLAPCLCGAAHTTNLDALVDWLYIQMTDPDVLPYVGSAQLQGVLRARLERWFFDLQDVQP